MSSDKLGAGGCSSHGGGWRGEEAHITGLAVCLSTVTVHVVARAHNELLANTIVTNSLYVNS